MDPRSTTVERALGILNLPDLTDANIQQLARYMVRDQGEALMFAIKPHFAPVTYALVDDIERWLEVGLLKLRADKAQLLAHVDAP